MKNFLIIILFFAATVCSANITMDLNDGVYVVKKDGLKGVPSAISVEIKAIIYSENFAEAISKPGVPVLVGQIEKTEKLKPLFKIIVEYRSQFIVYNDEEKKMSYVESKTTAEEPSYIILFSITSIILMVISRILLDKEWYGCFVAVVFAAAFAAIYACAIASAFSLAATVLALAAVLVFVTGVFILEDKKNYRTIFIILMTIHMVLLYI